MPKSVPCSPRTDRRTDVQTDTKVATVGTLSGFQEFFLQPIIKDRPNNFPIYTGLPDLGCYRDKYSDRDLPVRHCEAWGCDFIGSMSPTYCVQYCKTKG